MALRAQGLEIPEQAVSVGLARGAYDTSGGTGRQALAQSSRKAAEHLGKTEVFDIGKSLSAQERRQFARIEKR